MALNWGHRIESQLRNLNGGRGQTGQVREISEAGESPRAGLSVADQGAPAWRKEELLSIPSDCCRIGAGLSGGRSCHFSKEGQNLASNSGMAAGRLRFQSLRTGK